jgi:hypothetical protein
MPRCKQARGQDHLASERLQAERSLAFGRSQEGDAAVPL